LEYIDLPYIKSLRKTGRNIKGLAYKCFVEINIHVLKNRHDVSIFLYLLYIVYFINDIVE